MDLVLFHNLINMVGTLNNIETHLYGIFDKLNINRYKVCKCHLCTFFDGESFNNNFSIEQCYIDEDMLVCGSYDVPISSIVFNNKYVIQDPAGSAIGSKGTPKGGGMSGAIYKAFVEKGLSLGSIPYISEGESIFNTKSFDVIHTHSPMLSKRNYPTKESVLLKLIDNYYGTIKLFYETHYNNKKLMLVPVSGGIYAGHYKDMNLGRNGHLHPLYTLLAVNIALQKLSFKLKNVDVNRIKVYFYEEDIFLLANKIITNWKIVHK
eukprot:TRINITY_DN6483_c0_g1_i1.p1 TRINITY_DN6483_c0_g1~~TRINITY_DN6483_c0_g1_i1.p1  ORF type:complete len:264 (+),score=24.61 TRINITY_DN6483_c0_g1_i1:94-885(+)